MLRVADVCREVPRESLVLRVASVALSTVVLRVADVCREVPRESLDVACC